MPDHPTAPDEAATERCGNTITGLFDKRFMCEGRVGHPGAHHDGLTYWDRGESDDLTADALRAEVMQLLDANEGFGEAMVEIGLAVGLRPNGPGAWCGKTQILAALRRQAADELSREGQAMEHRVPAHVIAKVADALERHSGELGGDWFLHDCANALRGKVGADGSQFDPKDCRCLLTGRHTFTAPGCKLAVRGDGDA